MTGLLTLTDALEPLRTAPGQSAVLLDVDGTLAPIVRHADDAHVPEATRGLLIAIARRFGVVACVSGRRAAQARRIVGIGSITYVGNHGSELLAPGERSASLDARLAGWRERIRAFAREAGTAELARLRVRTEDKDIIEAFHWRGAPDEEAAKAAVAQLADRAVEAGLAVHWGRKVLEVRPPLPIDKGAGVRALLAGSAVSRAVYVGDDETDIDAFTAMRELRSEGVLEHAIAVGVRSEESPEALLARADVLVEGTDGARGLLAALAGAA